MHADESHGVNFETTRINVVNIGYMRGKNIYMRSRDRTCGYYIRARDRCARASSLISRAALPRLYEIPAIRAVRTGPRFLYLSLSYSVIRTRPIF